MWNSIKVAGTTLNWSWIDATAWLSTWQLEERGFTVLNKVCVCVCASVYFGLGELLHYPDLKSGLLWNLAHGWKTVSALPPPSVFHITLLVVHSKSVSSHLYRYVQLLKGHEFLTGAGKWRGKDEKPSSPYFSHGCIQLIALRQHAPASTLPCIYSPTNI